MRHRDIIDVANPARPLIQSIAADHDQVVRRYLRHRAYGDAAAFQRQLITFLDEGAGDTIATAWRKAVRVQLFKDAAKATAWKAGALNLDAGDPHMAIALACFAPMKCDGVWFLAVPLPLPCPMGPKFDAPEDIVLINPDTGAAHLYSGDTNCLTEGNQNDSFTVMANAKVWAREIAAYCVEWFYRRIDAARIANVSPSWTGSAPSVLAIGDQTKILWPHVKSIQAGTGIDAAKLKKTIFRQARITHVEAPMQIARAA